MDKQFQDLFNKMRELDAPVESTNENCMMAPMESPEESQSNMNININAKGIDDMQSILSLFQKVNPDAMPQDAPVAIELEPSDMGDDGMEPPEDGPELDMEPIDVTPDADDSDAIIDPAEPDSMNSEPEGEEEEGEEEEGEEEEGEEEEAKETKDQGNPYTDDEEKTEEAWDNEPDEKEYDIDTMIKKVAGGLNDGSAKTYPKVAGGDNPMQKQVESIKEELRKALAEKKAGPVTEAVDEGCSKKHKKDESLDEADAGISPDALQGLEELDLDALKVQAEKLIKSSRMTDRKKLALLRNVISSVRPENIIGLLWNSVLGKEGLHAIGSGWGKRFEAYAEAYRKSVPDSFDTWATLENGDEVDVTVGFDYQPEEAPVFYPNDSAHPGADEEISIYEVLTKDGEDVTDQVVDLDRIENEISDFVNEEPDGPEYEPDFESMQRLAGIEKKNELEEARDTQTADFTMPMELDELVGEVDYDLSVEYKMHGKYYPATREEPAEYPEIEIVSITDNDSGDDLTDEIIGGYYEEAIMEKLSEYEFDKDLDGGYDESAESGAMNQDLDSIRRLSGI